MKRRGRSTWSRRGIVLGCLWALAMLSTSTAVAPEASAAPARYVYEVCDPGLPGGNTPGVTFEGDPQYVSASNTCALPGGSLGIYAFQSRSKDTGHVNVWTVPIGAPPGGRVDSLAISAGTCGASGISSNFVYEPGWPLNCAGESQRTFHVDPSSPFSGVSIHLECLSTCAPGGSVYARYLAATEVDPIAPQLAAPQGSLFDGAIARGRQSLSGEATDGGGGVSEIDVLVNGQVAGRPSTPHCNVAQVANPSIVGTVAASPTPCPASLRSSWTLDTSAPPFQNGLNSVQVCASDFSTLGEPNSSCSAPRQVNVDNSCAESPVSGGETLSAKFAGPHDEEITVPFDHSAKVVGGLANGAGDAISGATICVQMQTQGSAQGLVPVATTTTDARGHFTYKVPPGPNREVLVGYRHDTFQLERSVRYHAHARPTLQITPSMIGNGSRALISGKVPGPSAAGRVVVLQASALHSSRWFTFHRATADRRGVFSSHYRFDETTRTTTYRIRAVVPRQHGYPWAAGHSRPALIEVRIGGGPSAAREFVRTSSLRSFEADDLDFTDRGTAGVAGDTPGHSIRGRTDERANLKERNFAVSGVAETEATVEQAFTGATDSIFAVGGRPFGIGGDGV